MLYEYNVIFVSWNNHPCFTSGCMCQVNSIKPIM